MTNEETIKIIEVARAEVEWEYPMDYAAAFDKAIEELKQEPCEDAISRRAVIDVIERWLECSDYNEAERHIMRAIRSVLYDSPSVKSQEPKTGRWIPVSERLPEPRVDVWVNSDIGQIQGYYEEHVGIWYASFGQGRDYLELIVNAWMPLPGPYQAESEVSDADGD